MAAHPIWESTPLTASSSASSMRSAHQPAPPQSRNSSRFFPNATPTWTLPEDASKPTTSNTRQHRASNGSPMNSLAGNSLAGNSSSGNGACPMHVEASARTINSQSGIPRDLLNRYYDAKMFDNLKNEIIEELAYRNEKLFEQYKRIFDEQERERENIRTYQRREKALQEQFMLVQTAVTQNPFVLVLINGHGMIFANNFLNKGNAGGREAGALLYNKVQTHLQLVRPDLQSNVKIVAYIYADIAALGDTCHKAGIVDRPSKVDEFAKGLTGFSSLFSFIDVGNSKERANERLTEHLKLYTHDFRCQRIFLGCSPEKEYARVLEGFATDKNAQELTLLEGTPFDPDFHRLQLDTAKFSPLFRETNMDAGPVNQSQFLNSSSFTNDTDGRSPSPSLSTLSHQLSEADIKEGTAVQLPQALCASSSTASAKPSPVMSWASAAAKPATPVTAVPSANAASVPIPKDQVPRNRSGQRIDPVIKHDKTEVDRVKKLKMCNVHFLRGECPYGDSCTHIHRYKPTPAEIQTLRLVARMAPCMHGSDCDDLKCIYGHICPAPEGKDGKNCIFGEQCRFPPEMHKVDRQVIKTIKV